MAQWWLAKHRYRQTHRSHGARLAGAGKSALNLEVFRGRLALVRDLFVFNDLPFIEPAEAGSLDRRDMDENIFAASLRLNEPVALLRIEPLHGTFSHRSAPNRLVSIVTLRRLLGA